MNDSPFEHLNVKDRIRVKLKKPLVGTVEGTVSFVAFDYSFVYLTRKTKDDYEISAEDVETMTLLPHIC